MIDLHNTTNAVVWAEEFVRLYGGDEDLMLTWFANAIMTGRDHATNRTEPSTLGAQQMNDVRKVAQQLWVLLGEYDDLRAEEAIPLITDFLAQRESIRTGWTEAKCESPSSAWDRCAERAAQICDRRKQEWLDIPDSRRSFSFRSLSHSARAKLTMRQQAYAAESQSCAIEIRTLKYEPPTGEEESLKSILRNSLNALKASHSYLEGDPYMKGDEIAIVVEETIKEVERALTDKTGALAL